jgi:CRP/FNR family transcriptional regulator, cyclic AMP receptor protein
VDPGDLLQRFGREFPRGTVLFREGDPGGEMYVVSRGKVSISARGGAVEKVLSTLGQGEFFGEMSILNDAPRSATATCVEDCLLLVVDARTFEAMVRGSAEIAVRMIQKLAGRLAEADRQIENLLLRDTRARVVHFVLGEAARRPGVPFGLSPEDLSSRLDVDARQAADVVRTLERSGLLSGSEGSWTVPDAERLRHFLDLLQLDKRSGTRP